MVLQNALSRSEILYQSVNFANKVTWQEGAWHGYLSIKVVLVGLCANCGGTKSRNLFGRMTFVTNKKAENSLMLPLQFCSSTHLPKINKSSVKCLFQSHIFTPISASGLPRSIQTYQSPFFIHCSLRFFCIFCDKFLTSFDYNHWVRYSERYWHAHCHLF